MSPVSYLASAVQRTTTLSLTDISQALPQPSDHPANASSGFSFQTEITEMDTSDYSLERFADTGSMRPESDSGAEPMIEEPPPSVPGSPTYPDAMGATSYSQAPSGETGFLARSNSFDSTAATLGSPRPSISGLESPFPTSVGVRRQSLIVMRHSERQDDTDPAWVNSADRPWDPPITERGKEIAFEVGRTLRTEAWEITRIVVSPFLRCVQTAAEVIGALAAVQLPGPQDSRKDITIDSSRIKVSIDYGLGEVMNPLAMRDTVSRKGKGVKDDLWLLPLEELEALLPTGTLDRGAVPIMAKLATYPESNEAADARFARTFDAIADRYMDENVLCISHGEAVSVSVSRLLPVTVYEVKYCGFSWAQRPVCAGGDEEGDSRPAGEWELLTDSGVTGISWLA